MKNTLGVIEVVFTVICLLALVGTLVAVVLCGTHDEELGTNLTDGWYYALTAQVVEVDIDNDVVTVEDYNGNLWEFEGVEDWQVGDCVSMLMNSRGTVNITDDVIERAHFSGWTLSR